MERIRFNFQAALCVVFLVLGHCAYSQTLWQNAQYGMTVEQVKGVYPNAASVTGITLPDDGSKELLRISEVIISSESFGVGFFFKNDKLTCVKLSSNDDYTQAQSERVHRVLKKSLNAKYGNAIGAGGSVGGNRRTENTKWASGRLDILLLKEEFIGERTTLEIFYRRGVVDTIDTDNL